MSDELFMSNKYTKWYFNIIKSRKIRILDKNEYYENHHIIPNCKPLNGLCTPENMVYLTPKEHFLVHWLLTKMCASSKGKAKMHHAFSMMRMRGKSKNRILSPAQYHILKINDRKIKTGYRWIYNTFTLEIQRLLSFETLPEGFEFGQKPPKEIEIKEKYTHSEETRIKMSISALNKPPMKDETKEKIRNANLGKINPPASDETKEKIRQSKLGKPRDQQTKDKLRAANLGKKASQETKNKMSAKRKGITKPKVCCPHCNHLVAINVSTRWHFDNCKLKS